TYRPPHSPFNTTTTKQTSLRKTMSITQTYYLAHKARAKLSTEAARADHDLRLLVGHANLLDSLMLDLADAEREQESWFNQSVRGAQEEKKDRHVQWADSIVEDPEEDWNAEDASSASDSDDSESDSEDEYDSDEEEDIEMADVMSLRRISSTTPTITTTTKQIPLLSVEEDEDDMEEDDLEEDYAQLELVRTSSHSNSPPELAHDSDYSSDDDDAMPPSPPNTILTFSEKDAKQEPASQQQQESFYSEGFYLPRRSPARLVSAISVY
ncbi:hypothetical protein ACHAQA_008109, partial [Verticillium albo-atrum]